MRSIAIACFAAVLFTGCGAPEPSQSERKAQEERAAKKEQEDAIRRVETSTQ